MIEIEPLKLAFSCFLLFAAGCTFGMLVARVWSRCR